MNIRQGQQDLGRQEPSPSNAPGLGINAHSTPQKVEQAGAQSKGRRGFALEGLHVLVRHVRKQNNLHQSC